MNPDPRAARQALDNAQKAVQRGDRHAARHWAELAASLDAELEEPWLILAALASPRSSVAYLEQALKVNPRSEQARKGMHWAAQRLRGVDVRSRQQSGTPPRDPGRAGITRPTRPSQRKVPAALQAVPPQDIPALRSRTTYRRSFLSLLLLVACLAAAWAVWPGNAVPALAFLRENIIPQSTPTDPGAPADIAKPSYTPTITPTFTPTETPTSTPTSTLTPTPTDTFTPTETFTPWPTPFPTATQLPPPTAEQAANLEGLGVGQGERWIDVNLSQQMVYAYEGDQVVASFLVSTGIWLYPTVTGHFHIYVKYRYTDMAGPGYYLPNVPYTMYFFRGYGLHGTYWHHNFGHPMSHGCVNMYTPDAAWLFNWASVGTLVNIHY